MKLLIKQTCTPTGYLVVLCNENGEILPGQLSLNIDSRPNNLVTATVVFAVGDDVTIVNGDQSPPIR